MVRRVPATAEEAKSGRSFTALSEAVAAAPKGKYTSIMIYDNGPLFEAPIKAADRNLNITAAPGYRPLLVWDLEKAKALAKKDKPDAGKEQPPAFLTVEKGNLRLDSVDLAV